MTIPIVITAFGTTSRAIKTYDRMDAVFKNRFADHDIHWTCTSRMVKERLKKKRNITQRHPHQVLEMLARQGHPGLGTRRRIHGKIPGRHPGTERYKILV